MIIEIYVQTSTKDFAVQKMAKAKWLICCVQGSTQQKTIDGTVCINNATTKQAALIALNEALARFNKSAVIKIYMSDDYVRNMLRADMPKRWAGHDWTKFRYRGPIKYLIQWQKYVHLISNHAVTYASADEVYDNKKLKELEWRMTNVRG